MSSFYQVPRRYDFPIPVYNESSIKGLNKAKHLNDIIKKLILMYLSEIPVSGDYRVEGTTFYTVDGDTVSGNTVYLNSGRATVLGNVLIIDYTGSYTVLGNTLYTTEQDSVSEGAWLVGSGTANNDRLIL